MKIMTLGVIFNNEMEHGNYDFDTLALVEIDESMNNFTVKSGRYEGMTDEDFIFVSSEKGYLDELPLEVELENNTDEKRKIFVYGPLSFNSRIQNANNSVRDAILKILSCVYNLGIHVNKDDTKFIVNLEKNKEPTEDEIEDIFKTKDDNFDDLYNLNSKDFKEYANEVLSDLQGSILPLLFGNPVFNIQKEDDDNHKIKLSVFAPVQTSLDPSLKEKVEKKKKEEVKKEYDIKTVDVNDMIKNISKKIVGQEDAIRTLVTNIYYNQVLIDKLTEEDNLNPSVLDSSKINILLDGETGTGKTAIEKEIARIFDLPIVITNANSFSETGYVGPTITDILIKLVEQCDGDVERAERGIIVLDEIDKIASRDGMQYDMKKGVQEELLSFIGGGEYNLDGGKPFSKSIPFDTSKITFILSGAFTDLREEKIKESKKTSTPMGFSSNANTDDRTYTVTSDDYIKYGLMREFFGRIKVLTGTKSYTIEDYKEILLKSEISPLKNFEKTVQMFGYKGIAFSDEFIDTLAREATNMKTGARSLQTIMLGIQNRMLLGLINHEFDENEPITLNSSLIEDYKKSNVRKY